MSKQKASPDYEEASIQLKKQTRESICNQQLFFIPAYESNKTVIKKTDKQDEKTQYQVPCFHRLDFIQCYSPK